MNNIKDIIEVILLTFTLAATVYLGCMANKLTKVYSKKSDKISNDALFHNLFRDFNKRYGVFNSYLVELAIKSKNGDYALTDLKNERKLYDKSIDYLNLCAEEYYWFKQGRIDEKVWSSWHFGMNYWYREIPVIRELWKEEIARDKYKSYYLKKRDNLFDEV